MQRSAGRQNRLIEVPLTAVDQIVRSGPTENAGLPPWPPAYVALLYGSGLGTVEALCLGLSAYRPKDGMIVVPGRPAILQYQAVDWQAREVPLLPRVREAVDAYLDAVPCATGGDTLLRDRDGRTPTRSRAFAAVAKATQAVGAPDIDPVRIRDAFIRAVWAKDRGLGHGRCLLGLRRDQYGLGRRAFDLPTFAELSAFLDAAHPWGSARGSVR